MISKVRRLNNVKRAEGINRVVMLLAILPVFHAAACLGQGNKMPVIDKIGTVCFASSVYVAANLSKKRETLEQKIMELQAKKNSCQY